MVVTFRCLSQMANRVAKSCSISSYWQQQQQAFLNAISITFCGGGRLNYNDLSFGRIAPPKWLMNYGGFYPRWPGLDQVKYLPTYWPNWHSSKQCGNRRMAEEGGREERWEEAFNNVFQKLYIKIYWIVSKYNCILRSLV